MSEKDFGEFEKAADGAIVVVTTVADGVRAGSLVGFHGQSSIDPSRYGVWLSKANHTYRVCLRATHLAVHFLTEQDLALAEHFGTTTGEDGDKFAGFPVTPNAHGVPLLDDLPHRLAGARRAMVDLGGDHAYVEIDVEEVDGAEPFVPLRFASVRHLRPGHEPEERSVSPEG